MGKSALLAKKNTSHQSQLKQWCCPDRRIVIVRRPHFFVCHHLLFRCRMYMLIQVIPRCTSPSHFTHAFVELKSFIFNSPLILNVYPWQKKPHNHTKTLPIQLRISFTIDQSPLTNPFSVSLLGFTISFQYIIFSLQFCIRLCLSIQHCNPLHRFQYQYHLRICNDEASFVQPPLPC